MSSWIHIAIEFLVGIGLLTWAADRFILSSVSIARHLRMSPIVIGMVLVGFGTSFPEIVVSAIAAMKGAPNLAMGNAIGSNIANIGLVVGVAALLIPIQIHSRLLKSEFPVLIGVTGLVALLLLDGRWSRWDGVILLLVLALHLVWMIVIMPRRQKIQDDVLVKEYVTDLKPRMALKPAILWWLFGLVLLFVASELIVNSATIVAKLLHISDFVIGLTIVAVGTSLPELAATVMSVIRHEHEIAIGNVVGSCIFNLLAVMAMPALIAPSVIPAQLLTRDYPILVIFTVCFWVFAVMPFKNARISRLEALLLLLGFVSYLCFLAMSTHTGAL